jgi:hypothetical protein
MRAGPGLVVGVGFEAVVVVDDDDAGFDELLHATARTVKNAMRARRRTGEDCTGAEGG